MVRRYDCRDYYYVEDDGEIATLRPLKGNNLKIRLSLLNNYVGNGLEQGCKLRVTTCGEEIINIKYYGG